MNTNIFIIVDNSGSMNEMSKLLIAKNLASYMNEENLYNLNAYSNISISFFTWNKEIKEFSFIDNSFHQIRAEGKSLLNILSTFIQEKTVDSSIEHVNKFILLTDGNFPKHELDMFVEYMENHIDIILFSIAIGVDADIIKLKKISSDECVFLSEDIAYAFNSILCYSHLPSLSTTLVEEAIKSKSSNSLGEGEDSWNG